MYWLRTNYKAWAEKQGIELMKEDLLFIEKILRKLPENIHKRLMRDYSQKWLEGIGEAKNAHQEQNLGRFRANSWLSRQLE